MVRDKLLSTLWTSNDDLCVTEENTLLWKHRIKLYECQGGLLHTPNEGPVVKANKHAMTVSQDHKITYFYRKTYWDIDVKDYMRKVYIVISHNSLHYKSIMHNNVCGSSNLLPSIFYRNTFEEKNANKDRLCPVCDTDWRCNYDFIQCNLCSGWIHSNSN